MKRIVSVSLGSSRRDHEVVTEFLGVPFSLARRGTDGDFAAAIALLKDLDGQVDAIGLGGIDIYLKVGSRRYALRDGLRLKEAVSRTPVVDGSGLKDTLERQAVNHLLHEGLLGPGIKVLMVSAADRFGMAEALVESGCDTVFGDLMFSMGMPYPIHTLTELDEIAQKLLPELAKMDFKTLYPTGKEQEEDSPKAAKFAAYYQEAEVIAGDFHYIRRYLPPEVKGKTIFTNTTTPQDVALLRQRGAARLVTTTPEIDGRSFGTNVLEAVFLVLLQKTWEEVDRTEYLDLLRQLDYKPCIRELNSQTESGG